LLFIIAFDIGYADLAKYLAIVKAVHRGGLTAAIAALVKFEGMRWLL
jgi:hypothetical protein